MLILKILDFFNEIRKLIFLQCTQREHVHNSNGKWARSCFKLDLYSLVFTRIFVLTGVALILGKR